MRNVTAVSVEKCTGCSACGSVCRDKAIRMQPDGEGFLFPAVDEALCTQCGRCLKACPAENTAYPNSEQPTFYAFLGTPELRSMSSSGGAFSYLAEWVLDNGGVVCGAEFSDDFLTVRHVLAGSKDELAGLRQSKYIQSDVGDCFLQIEEQLKNDRYVLFSGCPCQVAGLKAALGREYDKLLLVDVVCNSAPSPLAWQAYVKEASAGRALASASFRDKSLGWSPKVRMRFCDDTEFIEDSNVLSWIPPFVNGVFTRRSCHLCRFTRVSRQGDITLGDFWGIDVIDPALNDGGGVSMVSVNNAKGRLAFERALEGKETAALREVPYSAAVEGIPSRYYRGQNRHPGRNAFFAALREGRAYSQALKTAEEQRYDFGIMGWWYGKNYGAVLTSFALYKTVEQLGYSATLIDTSQVHLDEISLNFSKLVKNREFVYKHCDTTLPYTSLDKLDEINYECNGLIVGSDQLFVTWNGQLTNGSGKYYLDFAYDNRVKLAYGTSFGYDHVDMNALDKEIARFYLNRFNAVSSRESAGVAYIRDGLKLPVELVLDPVFLPEKTDYLKYTDEATCANDTNEPFIFAYILRYSEEKENILKLLAERTGMRVLLALTMNDEARSESWTIPHLGIISIEDWLCYMSRAAYVATDSFHGMCFSLIFEKPFITLTPWMGEGRFRSLAEPLGLESRILCDLPYIEANLPALLEAIDFAPIRNWIAAEREKSMAYLTNSLSSAPKGVALSDYDIMRLRLNKRAREVDARLADINNQIQSQAGGMQAFSTSLQEQASVMQAFSTSLQEQADGLQRQINGIINSKSYRIGRVLTYIPRKLRGGIRCLRDNGFKYTVVRTCDKIFGRNRNG